MRLGCSQTLVGGGSNSKWGRTKYLDLRIYSQSDFLVSIQGVRGILGPSVRGFGITLISAREKERRQPGELKNWSDQVFKASCCQIYVFKDA